MTTHTSTDSRARSNLLTADRLFSLIILFICSNGASIAFAANPVTTVMLSGMPAPGTPSGVTFAASTSAYSTVSLNDAGQVALSSNLVGPGVTSANINGNWVGTPGHLQLLVRQGDVVNSRDGPITWPGSAHPTINAVGQVLLDGEAVGFGTPGDFSVVAVSGSHAPGTSALTNFFTQSNAPAFQFSVVNDAGAIAFRGSLKDPALSGQYPSGIWTGSASNPSLVARSGQTLPGLTPQTIATDLSSPLVNSFGAVAFRGSYTKLTTGATGQGIWTDTAGILTAVVKEGDAAPTFPAGSIFTNLTSASLDYSDTGTVSFFANVTGPGVTGYAGGTWTAGPTGIEPVLLDGAQAPGFPSGYTVGVRGGPQTLSLPPPLFFNHTGGIVTHSSLSGPGINATAAIWAGTPNDLKLIFYFGQQAVGFPDGVTYFGLQPNNTSWPIYPVLNDFGQVAFYSFVSTFGQGIWGTDREGALHLVVKTGELLEVAPGDFRKVRSLSFTGTGSDSGGRPTGLNNSGQIAFWASFTDGTSGVFISNAVAVPEPTTFMLAVVGCAAAFLKRWRRRTV